MEGQPVWLASVSIAQNGITLSAGNLLPAERALVRALLDWAVDGVGDLERQRLFRMNLTTCLHRALTAEEVARLPASFHEGDAIDLGGGPVEILWQTVPERPSTQPCHAPRRSVPYPERPDLWIPEDCGVCAPCRARAAIASYQPYRW